MALPRKYYTFKYKLGSSGQSVKENVVPGWAIAAQKNSAGEL
jgi:hypothetical protein